MRLGSAINRLLRPFGWQLVRSTQTIPSRRVETSLKVFEACGGTIVAGPFKGTRLTNAFLWGDANIGAIVLGLYEQQLHESIEQLVSREPDLVVNVGCAEGSYAVGLARRLPGSRVVALDVESRAATIVGQNAVLNGVEERVRFMGAREWASVAKAIAKASRPALVLDCEGAEFEYLKDPQPFAHADLLIEVHPGPGRDTCDLVKGLERTHRVFQIEESGRDPHRAPILRSMTSVDKWLVVCEGRPRSMTWLWCESLRKGPIAASERNPGK